MATKTILVTIRFGCCHWMETKKGGIRHNPLLLVSVTHKDGRLKKNGCHLTITISQVEIEIFNCKERGHATCFSKLFNKSLTKNYDNRPFVMIEKIRLPFRK
jgi:hypothetical protein